jgi:hypothetical protein
MKDTSTFLVGILITDIQCFETKKRVPYKIVLELVDPLEFKYKKMSFENE